MKGKKRYLLVVLLLLLFGCGAFVTYSIYRTSLSGTGTLSTAKWAVQVKKGTTNVANLNFSASDVNWTTNPGKNGKIAPGATGTLTFTIDATGSEVDVLYEATVNTSSLPAGFTVTAAPTSGTIAYSTTSGAMKKDIVFNVAWSGSTSDNATKDSADIALNNTSATIPVQLTVRQAI